MAGELKIRIGEGLVEAIRAHGVRTYPHECCGALFGRDLNGGGGEREVLEVMALDNQREDSPGNRFAVAPLDVIAADRAAHAKGLEVVGWYHSHPDHPARPSEFDRQHAWPWYSYVIVKVEKGAAREMTSWRLKEDRGQYEEEEIRVEE